jgi:hypothetical protein
MLTNKTRNLRLLAILGLVALAVAGGNALASRTTGGQASHSGSRFISSGHARDLECSTCHQCELPTAEDPCLISCPRHHGHFDTDARADDGPDVVLIGELANLYDPVPFSHGLHAQMSDMIGGCENCHHYSEPGGRIPPCRECHDPDKTEVDLKMPSLKGAYHRQCMNCHLDWSHDKACSFCHKEHEEGMPIPDDPSDIVGVEHHPLIKATDSYFYETTYEKGPIVSFHHTDHVDQFGLDCVDCHSGDTCARCHDQQSKRTVPAGHITGSKGSCTSCHQERGCDFCHDYDRKPMFDHAESTGWPLGERHEDLECTDCHGTPKEFHLPQDECFDCHDDWLEGGFDHGEVTGVAFNEDHEGLDCTDCHKENRCYRQPRCDECHDDDRKYDPKTGFGG